MDPFYSDTKSSKIGQYGNKGGLKTSKILRRRYVRVGDANGLNY